jgi:hypothetical protein
MTARKIPRDEPLELVGLAEAADLPEISKAVLCDRRRRKYVPGDTLPPFPAPVAELKCGPVWKRTQIEAYRAEAQRLSQLSWFERNYPKRTSDAP